MSTTPTPPTAEGSPAEVPGIVDRYEHTARQVLDLIENAVEAGWSDRRIINRGKAMLRRQVTPIVIG